MNEEKRNDEKHGASEESFEAMLEHSLAKPAYFTPGEKVSAVVTQITKEWVFVDVGGKSDGSIAATEFTDEQGHLTLKEGDTVHAYFLSARDRDLVFTTRLSGDTTGREYLEEAYRSGIPVEGRIEREMKGGFSVAIPGGMRAFCPYSHMGLRRIHDPEKYLENQLTFKIIAYGKQGRNIVVSHRAILEEERRKEMKALRSTLQEGMTIRGEITSIHDFGAFIDIGGIEGLVPISEISWGRTEDIESILSVGQSVDVAIKKLDWEKEKFSFSMKDVQPDPWRHIAERYPEGSKHTGKVARLVPFGAFITLEPGVDGLIHISDLGKGKRINHPKEVLEKNQTVEIKVNRVDEVARRLSLEMVSDSQESDDVADFQKRVKKQMRGSSRSLGSLGEILQAKMEEKKKSE